MVFLKMANVSCYKNLGAVLQENLIFKKHPSGHTSHDCLGLPEKVFGGKFK